MKVTINKTHPSSADWRIPPGDMLADYLSYKKINEKDLSRYLGKELSFVPKLIRSEIPMTEEIAVKLATYFKMPEYYWVDSITKFQEFLINSRDKEITSTWFKEFPNDVFVKAEILKPTKTYEEVSYEIRELLNIEGNFVEGVNNFLIDRNLAYRSPEISDIDKNDLSKAVVIKMGENKYVENNYPKLDIEALKSLLPELGVLANLKPEEYTATLVEKLAQVGVGLIFSQTLKGIKVLAVCNGFTQNPHIQVFVGSTNESYVWYALIRGLAHIIHNPNRIFWYDDDSFDETHPEELEADNIAADCLLFNNNLYNFFDKYSTIAEVEDFAKKIQTKMGIIIYRLHQLKIKDETFGYKNCKRVIFEHDSLYYK